MNNKYSFTISLLDESEKLVKLNENKELYITIICCLIIDANFLFLLEKKLGQILPQGCVSYKDYRKKAKKDDKLSITQSISDCLKELDAKIIASIILFHKKATKSTRSERIFSGIIFILERVFLELKNYFKSKGIIIYDKTNSLDKKHLNEINSILMEEEVEFEKWDVKMGKFRETIIPNLFMIDDKQLLSLQIVDWIALSLNNACTNVLLRKLYIQKEVENLCNYSDYLKLYWDLFCKDKKTNRVKGYGIKIWVLFLIHHEIFRNQT